MPPPKQHTKEWLERRRLNERKRKERIKNNEVSREELLRKDRERYARKKAAGLIVSRHLMDPRELKILRRKNNKSAADYYQRKKNRALAASIGAYADLDETIGELFESDPEHSLPNQKLNKITISSEVLIKLVKQRPCLWNKSLSEYKDKVSRDAAWTEIYRHLEPEFDNLKNSAKRQIGIQVNKKWCNIRDAYVKARHNYRLNRTNKPYVYTKMLAFLDPFISERTEIVEERLESEDEGTDNWYNETVYLEEDEPAAKKPKIEIDLETDREENECSAIQLESDNVVALLTKMIHREEDEDRAFFKSIEPSVKALSEDSKLEFRIQVLKLIKDLKFRERTGITVNLKMTVDEH